MGIGGCYAETNFKNIPDELKQCHQWVNWKSVLRNEDSKPTKPPYQPTGNMAMTDDPTTWSNFLTVKAAANQFDGVGFVLTKDDPYVGLDFDHCRCPGLDGIGEEITGGLNMVIPEIAVHIRKLNTYTEVSPSGKGIRVFLKGKLPVDGKRKGPVEVYQSGRYMTVTGHVLDGSPRTIEPRQTEIDTFYRQVFGAPEEPPRREKTTPTNAPLYDWKSSLERAFGSKHGEEIRRLWNGDISAYPSRSEADLALCHHLAFWLAGDAAAIDSVFRESGLYARKVGREAPQ